LLFIPLAVEQALVDRRRIIGKAAEQAPPLKSAKVRRLQFDKVDSRASE
jgi:hypothetical protein